MRKEIKYLLLKTNVNLEKKCIFWNMTFSIFSSLQSAIMLLVVARINGAEDSGILAIAYAVSYLMFTIGTYGVRNFQVTDSKISYSYEDYRKIRVISCFFMIISSLVYCVWKNYEGYKMNIVLAICLLKLLEAIEDLYHGELQRIGRLDIAGCMGTIRLSIIFFIYIIVLLLTKNLFYAISFMIFLSLIVIVINRILLNEFFIKKYEKKEESKLIRLAISCFPLFITSFLGIYICNSPKYAIDTFLTEKEQAYYGIISMPVFTINLLSGIIYRPQLVKMARMWNENNREMFKNVILKQIRNIVLVAVMIFGFGFTIGIKILEVLYGISLVTLKYEFVILLLGGSMVAIYNFLTACITIMRKQLFLIVLSVFIMLLAYVLSNTMVRYAGLMGASCLYLILMTCEMLIVFIALWLNLRSIDK